MSFTIYFCLLSLAPPVTFKVKLKNLEVEEENSVTLFCELSKPGLTAEWRKGEELLKNGVKYQIKKREATMKLTIRNAVLEDTGFYSCVYAEAKTTATVNITRKRSCSWFAKTLFNFMGESLPLLSLAPVKGIFY